LRLLAYPSLFFVVMHLRNEGLYSLADYLNLSALAAIAMLHVLAWAFRHTLSESGAKPADGAPDANIQ
jgi:hypothetical protein